MLALSDFTFGALTGGNSRGDARAAFQKPWLLIADAGFDFERKPRPDGSSRGASRWLLVECYYVQGCDNEEEAIELKLRTTAETAIIPNRQAQANFALRAENSQLLTKLKSVERRVARMAREIFGWA